MSKKEQEERKKFILHLQKMADRVKSYPIWKQNLLPSDFSPLPKMREKEQERKNLDVLVVTLQDKITTNIRWMSGISAMSDDFKRYNTEAESYQTVIRLINKICGTHYVVYKR